jgi:opacity protein-like surface antigen
MDYDIDYRPGSRMLGISAWGDYSLFHGLGLEVEGTALSFSDPTRVYGFSQYAIKGGPIYKTRSIFGIHPYAKALFGVTDGNFFLASTPGYTNDDFITYSYGGGIEYKAWRNLYVRADYEYEFEQKYLSLHDLNPNGVTIGATYYLRAPRGYR